MIEDSKDLFETERILGICNRIKVKQIFYKSTLDIDTNDKEKIAYIEHKIVFECPFNGLFHLHKKPSATKGYHFILKCFIKCDVCRIVFDDFRRFAYDQNRPENARDILFDRSEKI